MAANPDEYDARMHFVEQVYYSSVYAVFIWDWCLCMWREYRVLWRKPTFSSYDPPARRWTLAKILYICCRYWTLLSMPVAIWAYTGEFSVDACQRLYRIPVVFAVFNQFFAQAALAWNTHRILASGPGLLVGLLVALGGVTAYQLYASLMFIALRPFVAPPVGSCFPDVTSRGFLGYFLGPLLYTAFLTAWAATRVCRMARTARAVALASASSADHDAPPSAAQSLYTIALAEGLAMHAAAVVVYATAVGVFVRFGRTEPHWMHASLFQAPLVYMFPAICGSNLLLDQTKRTLPDASGSSFFTSGIGTRSRSIAFARPTTSRYGETTKSHAGESVSQLEFAGSDGKDGSVDKGRREVRFGLRVDTTTATTVRPATPGCTASSASGAALLQPSPAVTPAGERSASADGDADSGQLSFAPPVEKEPPRTASWDVGPRLV